MQCVWPPRGNLIVRSRVLIKNRGALRTLNDDDEDVKADQDDAA